MTTDVASEIPTTPLNESEIPDAAIADLHSRLFSGNPPLSEEAQKFCNRETLIRYLTKFGSSTDGIVKCRPVEEAEQMLRETIAYRAEQVDGRSLMVSPAMVSNPTACCFLCVGHDKEGRPIIYGCPARASSSDVDDTMTHIAYGLEKVLPAGCKQQRWVWIVDFHGFGAKHVNMSLSLKMANIFKSHYREQLGALYLVDAPKALDAIVKVVGPVATPQTMSKLKQIRGLEAYKKLLLELMPEDIEAMNWLLVAFAMDPKPGSLPTMPDGWHPHFGRPYVAP